jgi:hypothetical protein
MGTTTPDVVLADLAAVIVGLTPEGGVASGLRAAYAESADHVAAWADQPISGLDRNFVLEGLQPNEADQMYGTTNMTDFSSPLILRIGHVCGKFKLDRDRRDKDLHQIAAQLQLVASYPDGVRLIRLVGSETEETEEGNFWLTTMRFKLEYHIPANYGG